MTKQTFTRDRDPSHLPVTGAFEAEGLKVGFEISGNTRLPATYPDPDDREHR